VVVHLPGLSRPGRHQPCRERAIPGMVNARKVWGGHRTGEGAWTQQVLVSVLRTCGQQGKDVFVRLVRLLRSPQGITLDLGPGLPSATPALFPARIGDLRRTYVWERRVGADAPSRPGVLGPGGDGDRPHPG